VGGGNTGEVRVAAPAKGDSYGRRHEQRKQAPARIAAATPIDATMIDSSAMAPRVVERAPESISAAGAKRPRAGIRAASLDEGDSQIPS